MTRIDGKAKNGRSRLQCFVCYGDLGLLLSKMLRVLRRPGFCVVEILLVSVLLLLFLNWRIVREATTVQ
jgi:hypothetical protein